MSPREALDHVRERYEKRDRQYRDQWGRWTVDDHVSISVLLPLIEIAVANDEIEQERHASPD